MKRTLLFLAISFFLMSGTAHAIILVDIPNVPGDSAVKGFEKLITATSVSADFKLNSCDDVEFGKYLDVSTPLLVAAAVTGGIFPEIEILFLSSGGEAVPVVFLSLLLKEVVIVGVSTSGDSDARPIEVVRLRAQSIAIKYIENNTPIVREVVCAERLKK